ncbi:MAG: peptidoglycan editing factor PgeF [Litorivicinaceae bacterium]|jgi:polyphenol oxidase|nr:peptidoglycan editing factor PgeF [Litorivicinaceae bacterium]MDP5328624.1 peptidoglycan editing factor PgeF [Litorivicinaceae bacterium]MDP5330572.1 peptidoglycan editing factor PgeF [Litorivicinaceae bacterium]MDP5340648.1 peptidoglycan editing factor PgeF [Litorivicinaceae bacterium]MDP5363733.1 peptidoglycan editing factor PgeF [Litorivicinaceae bacterium]
MTTDLWFDTQLTPNTWIRQTLRGSGAGPYGGFNLGLHVGDHPSVVTQHRAFLAAQLGMPVHFVSQVHGVMVHEVAKTSMESIEADAMVTREPLQALAILTADCLPIVFASATAVGIAHGGWRGILAGVVTETLQRLDGSSCHAWLGPCIGRETFEVGRDVRDAFLAQDASLERFFQTTARPMHWWCDLRGIVHTQLTAVGVDVIDVSAECTLSQPERYYSYRRDGITGRMATVVWRTE